MAFNVRTAGLLTTGTTGPDLFLLQSAAVQASTIQGLAGNDTIYATAGAPSATAVLLDAAGGADTIQLSGGDYENTQILGGAGGDSITIVSGTNFANSTINGGDGGDTITLASGNFILLA